MIDEQRRRAYLGAMQVTSWLPRVALPFAAPSRPELLAVTLPAESTRPQVTPSGRSGPGSRPQGAVPAAEPAVSRKAPVVPLRPRVAKPPAAPRDTAAPPAPRREPPPRFALQLLRAGNCLLLAELPTGEPFASRDPAYRLLRDLLRAAGLPDSPRPLGEPIRWPLIRNNPEFDQGPAAARDYVRTVLQSQLEQEPTACTWLLGMPAQRFAASEAAPEACREIDLDGLGTGWALPGLEQLMETPALKAGVWHSMRRLMRRWTNEA
ncbi:hypothetical protein NGA35_08810 [Pseudomonas stutzeri]|nr:hypothetical protein [Stutzerimonas stutzeri]